METAIKQGTQTQVTVTDTASQQLADHFAGRISLNDGGSSVARNADMIYSEGSVAESRISNAFEKQQLKQMRAQCLVFMAFRNGLIPKELHLEIALENICSEEE